MNLPRVYMRSPSWTPLPPPTPYHLSGSSPCTSPKHPVSCIEHRLVIRFLHDSIHASMPFSQIIPPSPSPSEFKSPFYTSVSLFILSFYLSFYSVLFFFSLLLVAFCLFPTQHGLQGLGSQARYWAWVLAVGVLSSIHWTNKEFQVPRNINRCEISWKSSSHHQDQ